MPSGNRNMVINSRERAVSTDINRLQSFLASELGQAFYQMCGRYSASDDRSPGVESDPATITAPPFNCILNGLRFYPLNGTTDALVTPGAALVDNAAAGADDAAFLYCDDPGVTAVGTLSLTTGAGATRIDIVECQPYTAVLETDSRDIYTIATGVFAPAMVTKVTASRMMYRIRTGVAGAGMPALAIGWIPLAVVRVPAAAANWDACDIWDVRNLVSEFWNAPFNSCLTVAEVTEAYLSAQETIAPVPYDVQLTGKVSGHFKHFRIGGSRIQNYPTDSAYVAVSSGTYNWEAGLAITPGMPWYVYLAFPFGLPGWRKYCSSATSPRVPTGLRGIPIVASSAKSPNPDRTPIAALALPTVLGFGGTTLEAVCIFAGMANAAGNIRGAVSDGALVLMKEPQLVAPTTSDPLVSGITKYTLADTLNTPSFAKSILVEIGLALNKAGAPGSPLPVEVVPTLRIYDNITGTNIICEMLLPRQTTFLPAAGVTASWTIPVEIPLPYRAAPSGVIFDIVWGINSDGPAFTAIIMDQLYIRGWRLN